VERAGVRDAAAFRIEGVPYLRYNRFLAALKNRPLSPPQRETWLRRMGALDAASRKKEIANLPESEIDKLLNEFAAGTGRNGLIRYTAECADRLMTADTDPAGNSPSFADRIEAPEEYSSILRTVGLYPVTSLPVKYLTERVHRRIRARYDTPPGKLEMRGKLIAYGPGKESDSGPGALDGYRHLRRGRLGIPDLSGGAAKRLAAALAPIFLQDVASDIDRPGRIVWGEKGAEVDLAQPVVYYYFTDALVKEEPLLQINYVVWYSGRRDPAPMIEWGHLDGLTVRVTLDSDGEPIMVDAMNNCGCYHLFFPSRAHVGKAIPDDAGLYPFVPAALPDGYPRDRLILRVNSGWHQVEHIITDPGLHTVPYRLLPYERLESIPKIGGGAESLFTPDGIAKGSGRIEPLILFPMGIPDVGSMRQRGHHPIKLVGRGYFDDPLLFQRHFEFK
jgi:hypothetical protein